MTQSLDFRIDALRKLESVLQKRTDDILTALKTDLGKPELEAYVAEVFFMLTEIRLFCKKLKRWAKPKRAGHPFYFLPARSEIRREPFGTSLVIGPWNYPVQLALSPLVTSVAAGNCVILKPSEIASASSAILAETVAEAFDPAHVAVVEGGAEVSKSLLNQPFDFIFYTGSERVGKIVAEAAAKHLTPTVLELGGKCPCVVGKDIDLEITASRIAWAKFFNAGQTCFSPDFVVAHESIRDELAKKIVEKVTAFYAEDPINDFGKIVSESHFERLSEMLPDSSDVTKIGKDDPEIRHLAPRILSSADWLDPAMQDEIFGPVLPVLEFQTEADLVSKLQDLSSPLALYVFSRDKAFCETIVGAIRSGSVCINDLTKQSSNLDLPFGGVGKSGMGRYRGKFGFEAFTYQRPVTRRYFVKDFFATHPPYGDKLEKMRRFLK
ncbi:UNVERIFIED_CONTAM: hypothetical protein GTU68_043655 [Idotea baltica]|nr:hypothetical protein [Idotea baltica]